MGATASSMTARKPYSDPDFAWSEARADLQALGNSDPSDEQIAAHVERAQREWLGAQRHAELVDATARGAAAGNAIAVSIPEAARMLGYSENHFRARVLPDLRVIGGTRPRILVADLRAWADDQKAIGSLSVAASGRSASATMASGTNTRPASKRQPRRSARAKQLLERASRSTPQRSKGDE